MPTPSVPRPVARRARRVIALVASVLFAGAADRAFVQIGIGCATQVWIYRAVTLLAPVAAFLLLVICNCSLSVRPHRNG